MRINLSYFWYVCLEAERKINLVVGHLGSSKFGASSIRLSFASSVRLSRKDTRNLFILWLGLEHLHNFGRYGLTVVSFREGLCCVVDVTG